MRIHELLEACLEYIVCDGVLGSDPALLRAHIQKLDPAIDDDYFAHLWQLLVRKPNVEVVVAEDDEEGDLRPVGEDEEFPARNLAGLLLKYPRVRVRGSDDEIYYRLTGSRKRITKITPMIFNFLQVAARSRSAGMSAVELGPLFGCNQKSVFHYMKVLIQLGLCAKVPASLNGSSTSLLVYRRFLEQNPQYRAHQRLGDVDVKNEAADGEDGSAAPEAGVDGQSLGFDFQPFSEAELAAGHIPKERLLKVLESPGLRNHLLGNHNLLQVLGWPADDWLTRHRRQLQRHIATLVNDGIVEYVDVGNAQRACLRLTKYNPDYKPKEKDDADDIEEINEVPLNIDDYAQPYQYQGTAKMLQPVEGQFNYQLQEARDQGATLAELSDRVSGIFKRTLEFYVNRQDQIYLPAHLRHRAIRLVMESAHRERRLRCYNNDGYIELMARLGAPLPDVQMSTGTGGFADTSTRQIAATPASFISEMEVLAANVVPVGGGGGGKKGRPSLSSTPRRIGRPPKGRTPKEKKTPKEKTPKTKVNRYENTVQKRGRPRKYVIIVNPDGTRNRNIVGNLPTSPDYPEVLIHLKDLDLLVPAPPSYDGVGVPPPVTQTEIDQGKSTDFYRQFAPPRPNGHMYKDGKKRTPRKTLSKKKAAEGEGDGEGEGENDDEPEAEEGAADPDETVAAAEIAAAEVIAAKVAEEEAAQKTGDFEGEEEVEDEEVEREIDSLAPAQSGETTDGELAPPAKRRRVRSSLANEILPDGEAVAAVAEEAEALTAGPSTLELEPAPTPTPTRKTPARGRKRANVDLLSAPSTPIDTPTKRPRRGRSAKQPEPEPEPPAEPEPPMPAELEQATEPIAVEAAPEAVTEEAPAAVEKGEPAPTAPETPAPKKAWAVGNPPEPEAPQPVEVEPETQPTPASQGESQIDEIMTEGSRQATVEVDFEDDEPLVAIEEKKPYTRSRGPRVDVSVFRRTNEIFQCLSDMGGISTDQRLHHEIGPWAQKWAGTDHPNAPAVASGMDRKVFKRILNRLIEDGRAKMRVATMPTSTGRWVRQSVVYLADTPEDTVQEFVRKLMAAPLPGVTQVSAGRNKPAIEYSAFKRRPPTHVKKSESEDPGRPLSMRERLLTDSTVVGSMYNYQFGRCVRTRTLHQSLVEAFAAHPEADSVVSTSPRVFALPFLFEYIRIKDFFHIVQHREYDEVLYEWLQDPANLELRINELPEDIAARCNVGSKTSTSSKQLIRTLLGTLDFLNIVMPLQVTDEESATLKLDGTSRDHPQYFKHHDDINSTTYFMLYDVAPVWHVADPSLSLVGFMPAATSEDMEPLWDAIRSASIDSIQPHVQRMPKMPSFPFAPTVQGVLMGTYKEIDMCKTLRSRVHWRDDVRVNLEQARALRAERGKPHTDEELNQLAYDLCLKKPDLVNMLVRKEKARVQQRGGPPRERRNKEAYRNEDERDAIREELAQRIKAAREVFNERLATAAERAGVELTEEVQKYVAANRPMSHLGAMVTEEDLMAVIYSYQRHKQGVLPSRRNKLTARSARPSVPRPDRARKSSSLRDSSSSKIRRHRHNWSRDEEELFFDAEAVIRARCKGTTNRGRSAMNQLFPDLGDQVMRNKLKKLLDIPGRSAYFDRLVDAFHDLWVEHRGTAALPDPNPASHIDFDLKRHVTFMRQHVNKHLLRLPTSAQTAVKEQPIQDLPTNVSEITEKYSWEYLKHTNTSFDLVLDTAALAEETRLHNIALGSIVEGAQEDVKPDINIISGRRSGVIRSVIKMIVGSPHETYDMNQASSILSWPREEYEFIMSSMVNDGILLKSNVNQRTPGRMYGFHAGWLAASEGSLPADIDAEVTKAIKRFDEAEDRTVTWPLLGNSGDLAAVMSLVSNHELDFDLDDCDFPTLKQSRLMYNTRALNDDAFEFDFTVSRPEDPPRKWSPPPAMAPREAPTPRPWVGDLTANPWNVERIVKAVESAGANGIQRGDLQAQTQLPLEDVDASLAALALEEEPRIFWAGYDNARLVSAQHWDQWSVDLADRSKDTKDNQAEAVRVAPRRWVDIWGNNMPSEWERAVKLVVAHLVTRPGITEHSLMARVSSALDRLETCDVLQFLVDAGLATRGYSTDVDRPLPPVHATDVNETKGVVWQVTDDLWSR